jgi:hypothetical protein
MSEALKFSNICFDEDQRIQTAELKPIRFEMNPIESFSGEE